MIVPEAFCPICTELFDQAKPRILPCGHSVCQNCLRIILESRQFSCFYCKKPMLEPNATVFPCFINYGIWNVVRTMVDQKNNVCISQKEFEEKTKQYRREIQRRLQQNEEKMENRRETAKGKQKVQPEDISQEVDSEVIKQSNRLMPKRQKKLKKKKTKG